MNSEIAQSAEQLVQAVNCIMNPLVDHQKRAAAYTMCETFKSSSPLVAEVGQHLASLRFDPIIRRYGLQLLEDTVRFRWNNLDPVKKIWIKDKTMELVKNLPQCELRYIKEAHSCILLEMVKREWPQQWPTMLPEMDFLASAGVSQKEVVLLLLLRLAEDVEVLQKIPSCRRRSLSVAMREAMTQILKFIISAFMSHYQAFVTLGGEAPGLVEEKNCHILVANIALETLGCYLEWAPMANLEECCVIQTLPHFLELPMFRLEAARVLLALASRKGKMNDKTHSMALFNQPLQLLFQAIKDASRDSLLEENYKFLKVAVQVLVSLGMQLCSVRDQICLPANFSIFLQSLLELFNHPSPVISSFLPPLWTQFFIHKNISTRPEIKQMLPAFLQAAHAKLYRMGFPSASNSPSCDYSRLDFDDDDEFHELLTKLRAGAMDNLRWATLIDPVTCFQYCATCLQATLSLPSPESIDLGNEEIITCQLWLEWDALGSLLENVTSRLFFKNEGPQPQVADGVVLIQNLLLYQIKDPELLSLALTCLSALLVFTNQPGQTNNLLRPVLNKIFAAATYELPDDKGTAQIKKVRGLRKHACALLLKVAKNSPLFIFPAFAELKTFIFSLMGQSSPLSFLEKGLLLEAVAIVSSSLNNYDQQSAVLKDILDPFTSFVLSQEFTMAMNHPQTLVTYTGLNRPVGDSLLDDEFSRRRSKLSFLINTITNVVRRAECPKDMEVCRSGGYLDEHGEARNPAAPHILPLIPYLLKFAKLLNYLWSRPEQFHADWLICLSMPQADQNTLMGQKSNFKKSALTQIQERVQSFFNLNELCFALLGHMCANLGIVLYREPTLASLLTESFLDFLKFLPFFKIKIFLRSFMRPYLQHCPSTLLKEHAIPLLRVGCPFMWEALSFRWQKFTGLDEDSAEMEVMKDELNRQISREYLDFLLNFLLKSYKPGLTQVEEESLRPSSLGLLALADNELRSCLTLTACLALSWPDSLACRSSTSLCLLIFNHFHRETTLDEGHFYLRSVIHGLQQNGKDDELSHSKLIVLGAHIYESLRPRMAQLRDGLAASIACTDLAATEQFDMKFFNMNLTPKNRREIFKNFVSKYIGENSCCAKHEHYRDLGPIFSFRPKEPNIIDDTRDVGLPALFNSQDS